MGEALGLAGLPGTRLVGWRLRFATTSKPTTMAAIKRRSDSGDPEGPSALRGYGERRSHPVRQRGAWRTSHLVEHVTELSAEVLVRHLRKPPRG